MSTKPVLATGSTDIALVVIGPKRQASRFTSADAGAAAKLARSLKMQAVRVTTERLRDVARRLPAGKLSAKWPKGMQEVRPALYKQLLSATGSDAPAKTSAAPTPAPATTGKAAAPVPEKPGSGDGRPNFVRGSLVLATQDPDNEGWWACEVQHVDGDTLTLKWTSAKELGPFNRRRDQVAPHPTAKPC
ncbi:hypothetical protein RPMA_07115 [Tardiphaga alba]|uniref:Uncharacterized protein n=1 Tax=Tardiphaga alba TaxID=340268 RepID=A0ABX8A9Z7_9BRAD|nr:hypothetical protein [Tardiphaga alba]QUS38630.1 hypothetical protein RPMA_07115 [Tardiphaga alba]